MNIEARIYILRSYQLAGLKISQFVFGNDIVKRF